MRKQNLITTITTIFLAVSLVGCGTTTSTVTITSSVPEVNPTVSVSTEVSTEASPEVSVEVKEPEASTEASVEESELPLSGMTEAEFIEYLDTVIYADQSMTMVTGEVVTFPIDKESDFDKGSCFDDYLKELVSNDASIAECTFGEYFGPLSSELISYAKSDNETIKEYMDSWDAYYKAEEDYFATNHTFGDFDRADF